MQTQPFRPIGGAATTTNLAVTTSSQSLTLPATAATVERTIIFTNVGTQTVFVAFGGTATTTTSMPILPNAAVPVLVPDTLLSVSAIAGATGSTLYATVGHG